MEAAKRASVLSEITELFLESHESVPDFLRQVLLKANQLISADLGFVGIVEEAEGANWVVVWDPAHDIIGASSGNWRKYFGRLRVGGEELPDGERSFVGYVATAKQPRRSDDVSTDEFYRASNEEIRSEL